MIGQLIEMHSVSAQIAIRSTQPTIEINTQKPDMQIIRDKGSYNIETKNVKLQLDSTACLAEEGIRSVSDTISQAASDGKQAALEGIGRRAREGDQLLDFTYKGNTFAAIAKQNYFQEKQFGLGYIPSTRPVISWEKNSVNIDIEPDKIHVEAQTDQKAQIDPHRGHVNVSLAREQSLEINYIGQPNYFPPKLDVTA